MARLIPALAVFACLAGAGTGASAGPPWPTFAVDASVRLAITDVPVSDVLSVEGNLFTTAVATL